MQETLPAKSKLQGCLPVRVKDGYMNLFLGL